jgi:hypothetical protein
VYRPAQLRPEKLKEGYDWAYQEFYRWNAIARASLHHGTLKHQAKHFFYAAGWKRFEPLWDMVIRARQLTRMTPLLEGVLSRVTGKREPRVQPEGAVFPIVSNDSIDLGRNSNDGPARSTTHAGNERLVQIHDAS